MTTVGVAIPSIPPRGALLVRALASVCSQTRVPDAISVAVDHAHGGAAVTRNRAWRALDTDWVAFLDDDDELLPHHLALCLDVAEREQADMVHPWFEVVGGRDPFPHHRGRTFDLDAPHQTTIVCVWRRSLLERLDGFHEPGAATDDEGNLAGEDFDLVVRAKRADAHLVPIAETSWKWHHHSTGGIGNTSGRGDRW